MANPKFGSPAWRKKYGLDKGRTNKPRRKAKQRKKTASHRRGTAAKRSRMKEMVRGNPPSKWMKVKAVRVVTRGGRRIMEVKK